MIERLSTDSETVRITIAHEDAVGTRALRRQYNEEHEAAKKAGHEGWKIGNFEELDRDEDGPIRMLYYTNGGVKGHVEGLELEGWFAYGPPIPDLDEGEYHKINHEPVDTLLEAQALLKEYVDRHELYARGSIGTLD